jgi:ketosteroid isomerase-like protein
MDCACHREERPAILANFFLDQERLQNRTHKRINHMHKIIFALVIAVVAAGPAFASDKKDVMATVNQFMESFNKGDMKMMVAACADQVSIIDEFAPHEWHGKGAAAKWATDYEADAKKNGITDGVVTLSKPRHVDITGDHAYVVGAADYGYKEKGKPAKETGSILTVALHKGANGWRITAWSWAKN